MVENQQQIMSRTRYLVEVLDTIESSLFKHESLIIELVGQAGVGKTVLINQLISFIEGQYLFPQLIKITGHSNLNMNDELNNYAERNGILSTISDLKKGNDSTTINKLFIQLFDVRKDFLLILIDDSHLLSESIISTLKQLFDSYNNDRIILILSGRENRLNDKSIQIESFSKSELSDYFNQLFYTDWVIKNSETVKWISNITGNLPFHLSLLINACIKQGLLSQYYVAPFDLFKQFKYPQSILEAVDKNYTLKELNKSKQKVIEYLVFSNRSKSLNEIHKFGIEVSQDELLQLEKGDWINQNDDQINLYHPLIPEIIIKQISSQNQNNYHLNIIENDKSISNEEKVHHLINLKKIPIKYNDFLLQHADELDNNKFIHSAYEILNHIEPKSVLIKYKIGRLLYHLHRFSESIDILIPLMKKTQFDEIDKVYSLIAECYFVTGKFKESVEMYEKVLTLDISDNSKYKMNANLIIKYFQVRDIENVDKTLKYLKNNSDKSNENRLEYLNAINIIHTVSPMDVDVIKTCNEGIEIAKTINNHHSIVKFKIYKMVFYKKLNNHEKVISICRENIDYAKVNMVPSIEVNSWINLGSSYANLGNYVKAIHSYERVIKLYEKLNTFSNYHSSKLNIGIWYYHIGKMKKAKLYYEYVIKHIDEIPKMQKQESKIAIGEYYLSEKEYEKSESILIESVNESKELKLPDFEMKATHLLSVIYFNKNREKSDTYFKLSEDYMVKHVKNNLLSEFYHYRINLLSENGNISNIEELINKWTKIDDSTQLKSAIIRFNILNGNKRGALAQLRELEQKFDGNSLLIFYKLYEWMSKCSKVPSKVKKRCKFLSDSIYSIMYDIDTEFKYSDIDFSKFSLLICDWRRALSSKEILFDTIECFTDKPNQQKYLKEVLSIWGIDLVDEYSIHLSAGKPIIINLLGVPELYLENRKLSIEDYHSRKTLEVLSYLIINGLNHKTGINKEKILDDLWEPSPEKRSSKNNYKNVTLHRLRKVFSSFKDEMIIMSNKEISFNWDSNLYRLDIDLFNDTANKGICYFKEGKIEEAKIELEIAISLYKGYLCEKVDGLWIESVRGSYHELFLESVNSLISIYKKYNELRLVSELLEKTLIQFPEIVQFKNELENIQYIEQQ
ncbi:MAG: tetratricopeptide repeat protein [Candidatus Marinimicrobia bacterium]|nr:tetratricopeptide repeat protein [Candidatus Neomarinimicrobiota bacterium]